MEEPKIAQPKGFYFEVKAGRRYMWCACGRSVNQPFCDGTHNDVPGGMPLDDPGSAANKVVVAVFPGDDALARLDNACYVFSPARAALTRRGAMAYCPVITPARGALYQSQFYVEIGEGIAPVIGTGGRHTVLFVTEGHGELEISGRRFVFGPRCGFYVRPDEALRVRNAHTQTIRLFISQRPGAEDLSFPDEMADNFDASNPDRMTEIDPARRQAMGERYFQILVSRQHGSTQMTQFTGHIPLSKAAPHRHLYEEAVIFLNGAGAVWTETRKAAVGPGDVLFLPRKQFHSVECTAEDGLDVVGVICPDDNPAVSY